ncbi:MAG: ribonuclease T [Gammaproteobacteria bacterium]|nr:ribonuclease T [Gammaproteobacteria bacterium]
MSDETYPLIASRFRGFLPVVIDVETGGFNANTDALLEVAAVCLTMNDEGIMEIESEHFYNVQPFIGANIEEAALKFTGIDPNNPLRSAVNEHKAMTNILGPIRAAVKRNHCTRAILVGHNATFDLSFINAAVERCKIKRNPFHPFSAFDTASLAGLAYGQTVLAKACEAAEIPFEPAHAHSAIYDCRVTAELFCKIVNRWKDLGGWPD